LKHEEQKKVLINDDLTTRMETLEKILYEHQSGEVKFSTRIEETINAILKRLESLDNATKIKGDEVIKRILELENQTMIEKEELLTKLQALERTVNEDQVKELKLVNNIKKLSNESIDILRRVNYFENVTNEIKAELSERILRVENQSIVREGEIESKINKTIKEIEKKHSDWNKAKLVELQNGTKTNKAKIELLEKAFNITDLEAEKLQRRLQNFVNISMGNSERLNSLDNVTKTRSKEVLNRIEDLELKTEIRENNNLKELDNIKKSSNDTSEELRQQISNLEMKFQYLIEENERKIEKLEKEINASKIETEIEEMKAKIELVKEEVFGEIERLDTLNHKLRDTRAYSNLQAGMYNITLIKISRLTFVIKEL